MRRISIPADDPRGGASLPDAIVGLLLAAAGLLLATTVVAPAVRTMGAAASTIERMHDLWEEIAP